MPESAPNSGHAVLDGLYELHDTVGTGGFAKVKVATHLQTGLKVNPKLMIIIAIQFEHECILRNYPGCNKNHGQKTVGRGPTENKTRDCCDESVVPSEHL